MADAGRQPESTASRAEAPRPPRLPGRGPATPPPLPERPPAHDPLSRPLVGGIALGILGAIVAGLFYLPPTHPDAPPAKSVVPGNQNGPPVVPTVNVAVGDAAAAVDPSPEAPTVDAGGHRVDEADVESGVEDAAVAPRPHSVETAPMASRPSLQAAPTATANGGLELIEIPQPRSGLDSIPQTVELPGLLSSPPEEIELHLLGSRRVLSPGSHFTVRRVKADESFAAAWDVILETDNAISPGPRVASFRCENDATSFRWDSSAARVTSAAALRYCILESRGGDRVRRHRLCNPPVVTLPGTDFLSGTLRWKIPIEAGLEPQSEQLRMDVILEQFPRHQIHDSAGLRIGDTSTIQFFTAAAEDDPGRVFAEVNLEFQLENNQPAVRMETFLFPPTAEPNEIDGPQPTRVSRSWLNEQKNQKARLDGTLKAALRDTTRNIQRLRARLRLMEQKITAVQTGTLDTLTTAQEAQLSRLEAQKSQLELELSKQQTDEQSLNNRRDALLKFREQWLPQIAAEFERIQSTGLMRLRVYLSATTDEVEIDLVRVVAGQEAQ